MPPNTTASDALSDQLEDLLDLIDADDWSVNDEGDLVCPHNYAIEPDGDCPEGCISPLLEHGVI